MLNTVAYYLPDKVDYYGYRLILESLNSMRQLNVKRSLYGSTSRGRVQGRARCARPDLSYIVPYRLPFTFNTLLQSTAVEIPEIIRPPGPTTTRSKSPALHNSQPKKDRIIEMKIPAPRTSINNDHAGEHVFKKVFKKFFSSH